MYSIEKCLPALLLCYNRVVESSILINWIQQSETCELVLVIICNSANYLLFLFFFVLVGYKDILAVPKPSLSSKALSLVVVCLFWVVVLFFCQ